MTRLLVHIRCRLFRAVVRLLPVCSAWLLACGCASLPPASPVEAGFLASRDVDLTGAARVRVAGPFYESQAADGGASFQAVRPLTSRVEALGGQRRRTDLLWPVGMSKVFHDQRTWRLLNFYGHDFDVTRDDSRYRFWALPVVFTGRDAAGQGYFALFPLGGTLHEFLGRDTIRFVLFPLYGHSTVGDLETHSVLWPIVSWSRGDEESRFRVFPLYGRSINRERWDKRFVMWPIWTSARYTYPGDEGHAFILFPLLGRMQARDVKSVLILPPFFRFTEGANTRLVNAPWPFFQYSTGDVDKRYLWPLWGRKSVGSVHTAFALWPIVRTERMEGPREWRTRQFVLPFVYHAARWTPARAGGGAATNVSARTLKLWPLMSYQREGESVHWRALDLWPAPRTAVIERNYAPLWTLVSHRREGDAVEDELLWGLARRRVEPDGSRRLALFPLWESERGAERERGQWSILKGLVGYERAGLKKEWRLLYWLRFGFGGVDEKAEAPGD